MPHDVNCCSVANIKSMFNLDLKKVKLRDYLTKRRVSVQVTTSLNVCKFIENSPNFEHIVQSLLNKCHFGVCS
jgi:hypothetical protein